MVYLYPISLKAIRSQGNRCALFRDYQNRAFSFLHVISVPDTTLCLVHHWIHKFPKKVHKLNDTFFLRESSNKFIILLRSFSWFSQASLIVKKVFCSNRFVEKIKSVEEIFLISTCQLSLS